ncbi:M50 family metallopeptidase [Chloroflexota bacterium]
MQLTERRRSLGLAIIAFVLVLLIWQISQLSVVLIPFRYFVTTIHELGHGLTALISGGQFIKYEVYPSGAGVATTAGGTRWLVTSAGYVFTAFFGAVLLFLVNRTRYTKAIAMGLGIGFAVVTVIFARNPTALGAGILTAGGLMLLGWKGPVWLVTLILNILAFLTALNALLDIWGLLNSLNTNVVLRLGNVPNDAYAMAQHIPILPAAGWALLWLLLALGLLGLSVYFTFWRPVRNGEI